MNVYESIVQGLTEAIAFEQGKCKAKTTKLSVAPLPELQASEIRGIRTSLDMTQAVFAAVMGVSPKTVESWETGTNAPSGTARRMLSMLKADPKLPEKYDLISK